LQYERMIVIDRLRIQLQPVPRVEMLVATYLRPGTKTDRPASPAAPPGAPPPITTLPSTSIPTSLPAAAPKVP
ncbi:hypothetical protein ACS22S_27455, partial [Klebsiella pneumoniae]|uniref:hypothetical protein n=1 Tax=Klebsiella pneumoniae TaxID=573 RepID=UPI003F288CF3